MGRIGGGSEDFSCFLHGGWERQRISVLLPAEQTVVIWAEVNPL